MAGPQDNILNVVNTISEITLSDLDSIGNIINNANGEHSDFNYNSASYGGSVQIPIPVQAKYNDGLALPGGQFDELLQQTVTLSVGQDNDHRANVNYAVSTVDRLFNQIDNPKWHDYISTSYTKRLVHGMETRVAKIMTKPYRSFGSWDGTNGTITPLNTYELLSTWATRQRAYGHTGSMKVWLPQNVPSEVINLGFSQFVPGRNDRNFETWRLGTWNNAEWYPSTALPVHISGTMAASPGQPQEDLTFVSINASGDQITFATTGTGKGVVVDDLIRFDATTAGPGTNLRYLTNIDKDRFSDDLVSVRVTAAASEAGGQLIVNITPPLIVKTDVANKGEYYGNLSRALAVTDIAHVAPSHRRGMMVSDNALFVAVPKLPDVDPYQSSIVSPITNLSARVTWGSLFETRDTGFIIDAVWGEQIIPEYCSTGIFPIS